MSNSPSRSEDARSQSTSPANGIATAVVVLLVVFLPLIYFLSLGPAIVLVENDQLDLEMAQTLYLPLEWLAKHTPLGPLIEWYARLWRG